MDGIKIAAYLIMIIVGVEFIYLQVSIVSMPYCELKESIFSEKTKKRIASLVLKYIMIALLVIIGLLFGLSEIELFVTIVLARLLHTLKTILHFKLYNIRRSQSTRIYLISKVVSVIITTIIAGVLSFHVGLLLMLI